MIGTRIYLNYFIYTDNIIKSKSVQLPDAMLQGCKIFTHDRSGWKSYRYDEVVVSR